MTKHLDTVKITTQTVRNFGKFLVRSSLLYIGDPSKEDWMEVIPTLDADGGISFVRRAKDGSTWTVEDHSIIEEIHFFSPSWKPSEMATIMQDLVTEDATSSFTSEEDGYHYDLTADTDCILSKPFTNLMTLYRGLVADVLKLFIVMEPNSNRIMQFLPLGEAREVYCVLGDHEHDPRLGLPDSYKIIVAPLFPEDKLEKLNDYPELHYRYAQTLLNWANLSTPGARYQPEDLDLIYI